MQYISKRLHYRVKGDNQQGQAGQRDVDIAPDANNETGALLALQGERQLLARLQGLVSALKIGGFARIQWWHGRVQAGSGVESLQAISFERFRFARTQTLDLIFQFKNALFEGARDADPVGAGITRSEE